MTAAAVLLVAAIAAVVSFVHIQNLAVTHGQTELSALLLPVSIDGTVAATSLTMIRSARSGLGTPWLARFGLVLSVLATLACNVGYGLAFGAVGALISGWPAVAFILCAELAIGMLRRSQPANLKSPGTLAVSQVAADAREAAQIALRASVAAGNPLSQRAVMTRFGLTRTAERTLRQSVLAESNGHAPDGGQP